MHLSERAASHSTRFPRPLIGLWDNEHCAGAGAIGIGAKPAKALRHLGKPDVRLRLIPKDKTSARLYLEKGACRRGFLQDRAAANQNGPREGAALKEEEFVQRLLIGT
jgi:hypothetical protein